MMTVEFITALFYEVDEQLRAIPKHPEAHLWPSEVVTLGLLHALKGGGNRAFYRWLTRDYRPLFPRLPERTRLFRLFTTHHDWTQAFLAAPTVLGVIDTYGIELIHPMREGRSPQQIGRKGLSNHRWIVGGKLCLLLNQWGLVVGWACATANVADNTFQWLVRFKASLANVTVQQRSLELAQELARENKVRVDAGLIPPLDLVQAEAEVAQRRENLIRARTLAEDSEDALRRLIVDPDDVSFWRVRLDPTEELTLVAPPPDVDAAVAKALGERYDLARAGHELEKAKTTVDFFQNQRLPDVRLETSYRSSGLAGTQFIRTGGFPGVVTGTRRLGLDDALGQVFTSDFPTWSLGLTVSYPIGKSYEAASMARAEVERRQAAARISSLRVQAAETVRRAGRQVHSTAQRVDAARSGATLAQERLASEQRRYDVGLSTSFLVTQAQRDLLEAQVSLLQTTLDYESAVVNFEAVQQAPPLAEGDTVGGTRSIVLPLLPAPSPRGIFRPGSGPGF